MLVFDARPDHLSGRAGFGSVRFEFRVKNIGPCPVHDMVGSGRIRVGSGWPAILCVIF